MSVEALLVIDIQRDYLAGGRMPLAGAVAAAAEAARLLGRWRERSLPVVHVHHVSARPGATFFLPGTEGILPAPGLEPAPGEAVVVKRYPNSFRGTGLEALLRGLGAERLAVAGMMPHMCLDASVRAAFDLGFPCRVAADACATRDLAFAGRTVAAAEVHAAFLAALAGTYAEVVAGADMLG